MSLESPMPFHAALARCLVDHGVTTMFGLIGDGNLFMVDSFVRLFGGTFVSAAGEAGATVMALGYAMAADEVGVATVTHGPALTNTMTGLVEGVKGRIPMLLVCGDTADENRDGAQNIGQRELVLATGAGFEQLRSPRTLSGDVARAKRRAILERRPIALNVPVDFTWVDVDYQRMVPSIPELRGMVSSGQDVDNGIGIIAAARQPVILVGRGAVHADARAAILRLARRIGAPVGTTLKAKDAFRDEPENIGIIGTLSSAATIDAMLAADCLICFGAGLNRFTTSDGAFTKSTRIVQCNADASDMGLYVEADAQLVGDAALVADLIVQWLDEADIPTAAPFGAQAGDEGAAKARPQGAEGTVDLHETMVHLNTVLPRDRVLVTDCGRFITAPWQHVEVDDPRAFLYTLHFGAIGLGMPYAIGASFAAPGRPVLLVTGDGGWMLGGLTEFNTAVRHKIDLTVVVCNDGSYGAEYIQFARKDMDPGLSLFDWPDLAPVASALGGHGVTVRGVADLAAMDGAIASSARPLLIDLKLDPRT